MMEHLSQRVEAAAGGDEAAAIATLAVETADAIRLIERIDRARRISLDYATSSQLLQEAMNLINKQAAAIKKPARGGPAVPSSSLPAAITQRLEQLEAQLRELRQDGTAAVQRLEGALGGLRERLDSLERAAAVQALRWTIDHAHLYRFDNVVTTADGQD